MKLPKMVVLLLNGTQYERPKYGDKQYARPKWAPRSMQGGVTLVVMDCGTCIIFIKFSISDQV